MRHRFQELKPIVQGFELLVPVLWEKVEEKGSPAPLFLPSNPDELSNNNLYTETNLVIPTIVYYDCEAVLSKSLQYNDVKEAIDSQLDGLNRNKALGLLPKTIQQLTEPKYDLNTWEGIKLYRNKLLVESDWTQLPDAVADKDAWANYRKKLRDLPQEFELPYQVVFPKKP